MPNNQTYVRIERTHVHDIYHLDSRYTPLLPLATHLKQYDRPTILLSLFSYCYRGKVFVLFQFILIQIYN